MNRNTRTERTPSPMATPVEVRRPSNEELLVVFAWNTKVSALPEIIENGKTFVPL